MSTFKNITEHRVDVAEPYNFRLAPGDTFEVPDDADGPFEVNPFFAKSKTTTPTVTVDAETVAAAATPVAPAAIDAAPSA